MALNTKTITLAKAEGDTNYRGVFQAEGDFCIHAEFGKAVPVSVRTNTAGEAFEESYSGFRSGLDDDFGFLCYPKTIEVSVQDGGLTEAPVITVLSESTITTEN